MELSKRTELAFDYARDTTKQLTTLATGVVALTVTFSKDFIGSSPPELKHYVTGSWVLFLVSIVFGQLCLMGLTGKLGSQKQPPPSPNIYAGSIALPAIMQVLTFLGGLSLVVAFAVKSLRL
jgi:hypothetical protein